MRKPNHGFRGKSFPMTPHTDAVKRQSRGMAKLDARRRDFAKVAASGAYTEPGRVKV